MPPVDWKVNVKNHPGSTSEDLENEPDWGVGGHEHHTGFYNRQQHRRPGLTHSGDEVLDDSDEEALKKLADLRKREERGDLVNFRDVIEGDEVRV